jgi:hypothetical protein
MAENWQFILQAPHSMHESLFMIKAILLSSLYTLCGHTSMQVPQPVHKSGLTFRLSPFFKYFCIIMKTPFY